MTKTTLIKPKHKDVKHGERFDKDPTHARQGDIMRNRAGGFFVVTCRRVCWAKTSKNTASMYLKPQGLHTLAADMSQPSIRIPIASLKREGWVRITEKLV